MRGVIVRPSPVTIPETSALRRDSPRRAEDRQAGYDAEYDDRTIFYDAFQHGADIVLSGPPLFNLREPLLAGHVSVDHKVVEPAAIRLSDVERTQSSRILGTAGTRLSISEVAGPELTAQIGDDRNALFEGRRAIVTLLRGREHEGVAEWLSFHAAEHGVDAALIYATNTATPEQLLERLSGTSVDLVVVVDWPFRIGPGGGPRRKWDSDFAHYSALEHARVRFLQRSRGVLNAPPTQLVLTDDGRSVFAHAEGAPRHLLRFPGRQIEGATDIKHSEEQRSFRDYRYHRLIATPPRWVLIPDPTTVEWQWRIHSVGGSSPPLSLRILARDFANLVNRAAPDRKVEGGLDHLDQPLSDALDRALPDTSPAPASARLAKAVATTRRVRREYLVKRPRRHRDYGYLFIMTYGRTGSSLMRGILSSIPGYLIRGETRQMLYSLFTFHKTAVGERQRLLRSDPLPPTHPWFGIDGYRDGQAFADIRRLALDTLFRPQRDTRVVGSKEIEWFQKDLLEYLGFLRTVFPGARFIVNTRDLSEVANSKWWAQRPDAMREISEREARIMMAAEALGDAAYHVRYDDYANNPEALRGLFAWLGEPFDVDSIRATMAKTYSY